MHTLGGRNDLDALGKTVDIAAAVYYDPATDSAYAAYRKIIPLLTRIFSGKEQSNPLTIYNLSTNTPCAGMGRDPNDCAENNELGDYFGDTGFNDIFADGHNQVYHYWAYLSTAASAQGGAWL